MMHPGIPDDWIVVFEAGRRASASERALVLTSLEIPHELLRIEDTYHLVVPVEFGERAKYELWQYAQENRPRRRREPPPPLPQQNPLPGVVGYVVAVCLAAWLAGDAAFGRDWLAAGRVDGELIRAGEWWRGITALTLHANLKHLAGNIVFGTLFGLLAGRIAGSGVAWLTIVVTGGLGNLLNTVLLASSHRAIGASTAVFAALGLLSGFVWRGRFMAQDRWPYRLGPIVGGIALLAYTGTGDENTDIGAHLAGFACGFGAGMLLIRAASRLDDRRLQLACGIAAAGLVVTAWVVALSLQAAASMA